MPALLKRRAKSAAAELNSCSRRAAHGRTSARRKSPSQKSAGFFDSPLYKGAFNRDVEDAVPYGLAVNLVLYRRGGPCVRPQGENGLPHHRARWFAMTEITFCFCQNPSSCLNPPCHCEERSDVAIRNPKCGQLSCELRF